MLCLSRLSERGGTVCLAKNNNPVLPVLCGDAQENQDHSSIQSTTWKTLPSTAQGHITAIKYKHGKSVLISPGSIMSTKQQGNKNWDRNSHSHLAAQQVSPVLPHMFPVSLHRCLHCSLSTGCCLQLLWDKISHRHCSLGLSMKSGRDDSTWNCGECLIVWKS